MALSKRRAEGDLAADTPGSQGRRPRLISLEMAQRIARETLQADHQALEFDTPGASVPPDPKAR